MSANLQSLVRIRAILAGWLLILFLLGPLASGGDLEPVLVGFSALEEQPAQIQVPESPVPDSATPETGTPETLAPANPEPLRGGDFLPASPGSKSASESQRPGFFSEMRLSQAAPVLLCLILSAGIAFWARKMSTASRQLREANAQLDDANHLLQRQIAELSWNNERLKKEAAEQRITEDALRASEHVYFSLVENVPQNIFRKDLKGRYTFVNRAFCSTLGKTAEEILGKTDQDLLPSDLATRLRREDKQVLASGEQIETQQPYPTADGGRMYVQMLRTALLDADKKPVGIQGIFWDQSERHHAQRDLVSAHRQLVEASRRVGMAEVATGVLHNVGNVLNSVNVSATLVCEQVKKSKVLAVGKVAALLSQHADDQKYLIEDERGKQLPGYLKDLAELLRKERGTMLEELDSLVKNIEHIKEIVVMQQNYAKLSGLSVAVKTSDMVEDALRMNSPALTRHEVTLVREFIDDPMIIVDKHTVLQILVNLIRNANYACEESRRPDKQVTVRIFNHGLDGINIQITDNGMGIPRENLSRLFSRGFTTRSDGHGFGLHSCLLAAKEMGGALSAHSDGPGMGAVFTLILPLQPPDPSA